MSTHLLNFFVALVFFFAILVARAQVSITDSAITFASLKVGYDFQYATGDMAKRFGNNSTINFELDYKSKSNYTFGIVYHFLFGGDIKNENQIFKALRDENGQIINGAGEYADLFLEQRGFVTKLQLGKIFNYLAPNPNCGPFVNVGIGYLQHRIQIRDFQNTVPQLSGDYRKGYDRLSNGLIVSQMVGYRYNSDNRLVNFFIGVEFSQGFTQEARKYSIDEMREVLGENRRDNFFALRFGWTLPLYKKVPREFYY